MERPNKEHSERIARVFGIAVTLLACTMLLVTVVFPWMEDRINDVRYGRPRIYHLAAVVGHDDAVTHPTLFVSMNLQGEVGVIEIPGGDYRKARQLTGPHLFGSGQDNTPVTVRLVDINGDGKLDLIVSIRAEEVVYMNTGASFQLATDQERDQYAKRGTK